MSPLGIALGVPWFDGLFGSTPAPVPYSLQYPGVDEYVSIPNSASLQVTGDQSWGIWCKLENINSTNHTLFGWRESGVAKYKLFMFKRANDDATAIYRNQFQVTISADGGTTNAKTYFTKGLTTTGWGLLVFTFTKQDIDILFNEYSLFVFCLFFYNFYFAWSRYSKNQKLINKFKTDNELQNVISDWKKD